MCVQSIAVPKGSLDSSMAGPVLCNILVWLGNVLPPHGGSSGLSFPEGHIPGVLRDSRSPGTPPGCQPYGWGGSSGHQAMGMWDLGSSFVSWDPCLHSRGVCGSSVLFSSGLGVGRVPVVGLQLSFRDVLVHKCSLNVREQSLLQAVCLGPVWPPQIIALKIGG